MRVGRGLVAAAVMAVMMGAGVVAQAQDVKVNWREKAPFQDFRTYRLVTTQPDPDHPFFTQYVPKYLNSALQSRGLRPAPAGTTADLKVSYHFRTQDVVDQRTTSDGFGWGGGPYGGWGGWGGYGGWGGPNWSTTRQVPRTMGVLTVDLAEARSNEVVWRGKAVEDNVAGSQHGKEDQVWKSVGKMFDHYPPKGDGK